MKGNLSIVFGEGSSVKFDLMENKYISEIDKYTSGLINSEDVRRHYSEEIDYFVNANRKELEEINDKRGRVVITYQDAENSDRIYRLRVLYQKNRNKLDPKYVLDSIVELLRIEKNPKLTMELIKANMFLFDSDFAKERLSSSYKMMNSKDKGQRTKLNNILTERIIEDVVSYRLKHDYEKAYFTVRRIDSFLERIKGYETTPLMKVVSVKQEEQVRVSFSKPVKRIESTNLQKPLTLEEFVSKLASTGERWSISDIELEYKEYLREYREKNEGNRFR